MYLVGIYICHHLANVFCCGALRFLSAKDVEGAPHALVPTNHLYKLIYSRDRLSALMHFALRAVRLVRLASVTPVAARFTCSYISSLSAAANLKPASSFSIKPVSTTQTRTMSAASAKRLAGKTVLITGASSGIGRSTALEFARACPADLRLILTARRIDTLRDVSALITKEVGDGVKILPVKLDVASPVEVSTFVGNLPDEWRDIDVLVNNA